jgi:hypothetical protein
LKIAGVRLTCTCLALNVSLTYHFTIHCDQGSKWWTVRSQAGVEAEWIGIKKDFKREEERYRKLQRRKTEVGKAVQIEKGKADEKKKEKPTHEEKLPDIEQEGECELGYEL